MGDAQNQILLYVFENKPSSWIVSFKAKKKTTTQLLSQFVTSVALISCRKDASRPPNVWARGNPAATTLLPQGSTVCVGLGRAPHSKNNKLHLRLLCGKDWHVLICSECTVGALCIIYTIDIMLYRCNATVVVYAFRVVSSVLALPICAYTVSIIKAPATFSIIVIVYAHQSKVGVYHI